MASDFCSVFGCGELLIPPPIPPVELLPRADCWEILKNCSVLSSLNGTWSTYSEPCLPAKVSTAIVTPPDGAFPDWLIGVIVVAAIFLVVLMIVIVVCIIKSKKRGERCLFSTREVFSSCIQFLSEKRVCLQRSKLSKWISLHLDCWKWWPRRRSQRHDLQDLDKDNPKITIPIVHEPQSPSSAGSTTPLSNRESLDLSHVHLDVSSNSLSEEIFKELDKNSTEAQIYVQFTNDVHSKNSKNRIYENVNNCKPNKQDVVVLVNVTNGEHKFQENFNSDKEPGPTPQNIQKCKHVAKDDTAMKSENQKLKGIQISKVSDDLALENMDSIKSLKVDSGYTSRNVSDENCSR